MNKLSNSAVDKYIECSYCYFLHYVQRIRPVRQKSALLFGAALDNALNELLLNKDSMTKDPLIAAKSVFYKHWSNVNSELTDFSKSDLDEELVEFNEKNGYPRIENNPTHRSLMYKGMLFIEQYYKEILPKIKKVISVQEPVSLKNTDGDEITGILDLIVEWKDGKTYLMDNKSSSVKYAVDSAKTGQQLPLYYYIAKDKYKLDGIGYIVMSKKINKNKVKKCKKCNNTCETTHKNCPIIYREALTLKEHRCNGEFEITINPSVDISIILNQVDESDEKRVIETFDMVNQKIINGEFSNEHPTTKNKYFQWCPYHDYYEGSPDFIKLPEKKGK